MELIKNFHYLRFPTWKLLLLSSLSRWFPGMKVKMVMLLWRMSSGLQLPHTASSFKDVRRVSGLQEGIFIT